jgi:outer membrane protein assembly factor BamB
VRRAVSRGIALARTGRYGRPIRHLPRICLIVACAALALGVPAAHGATPDWPGYLHGPGHSSRNAAASRWTPATAATIGTDWTFSDAPPTISGQPGRAFYASPTVSGGSVYIGSNTGVFYAIDESTGLERWHRLLGYTAGTTCSFGRGITSTATVAPDPSRGGQITVYVAGGDGYLYALKASDGSIVWRSLVTPIGTTQDTGYNWSSPTLIGGRVFVGISSQCDNPLIRGGLRSFDQASGTILHTYRSVPAGDVGGSIWTSAASDGTSVWATVGNGTSGDSFAMVRLDAATLAKQAMWIVPGTAGTDLDWGSSPTLFNATLSGTATPMVGACNKNGTYYALRAGALASGPVWSRRLGKTAGFAAGSGSCLAAAIWDGTNKRLFAGSNATTIGGVTYAGSVRSLNPATGKQVWVAPVGGGPIMGSPSLSGGNLIAAGTYNTVDATSNRVYLIDAATGAVVNAILPAAAVFAQPVFADADLFVATKAGKLTAYTAG